MTSDVCRLTKAIFSEMAKGEDDVSRGDLARRTTKNRCDWKGVGWQPSVDSKIHQPGSWPTKALDRALGNLGDLKLSAEQAARVGALQAGWKDGRN